MDAEGFRSAHPRGATAVAAPRATTTSPPPLAARSPVATANSWAVLAEEDHEDDERPGDVDDDMGLDGDARPGADADADERPGGSGGERDDDGTGDGQSEDQLKQAWLSHCAAVRLLERDGRAVPGELLAAARDQRDSAEKRWRAAKRPHPLHKRLRWAEAEVRDAESKEATRRRELRIHTEQAAAKTRDIESRLATDVARTARKRAALAALHREAGISTCHKSEQAARVAAEGLGSDVVPALSAIIGQLGDHDDGLRQNLRLLATSVQRVQDVLRVAAEDDLVARQPVKFDISDETNGDDGDGAGTGSGDGDGGGGSSGDRDHETRPPAAATVPRWTKPAAGAPWVRTSLDAVEAARSVVRRIEGATSASSAAAAQAGGAAATNILLQSGAYTNDLAEAERRERRLAEQCVAEVALHQQQRQQLTPQQRQQEEEERQQREQRQRDELLAHQVAMEQAAAARAADEQRQREQLIANMSPEELARAADLHAQQAAVAAAAFGTQAASQIAGLVHQAHARQVASASHCDDEAAEVDRLMAMSPEELAQHDREQQMRGLPP